MNELKRLDIKHKDLSKQLEVIKDNTTQVMTNKPAYNIIVINSASGQKRIRTNLSLVDWLKVQDLKPKNKKKPQTKKKKRK
jgi:penicillin V acylase-like amidase (Ntn superfamily)